MVLQQVDAVAVVVLLQLMADLRNLVPFGVANYRHHLHQHHVVDTEEFGGLQILREVVLNLGHRKKESFSKISNK